MFKFLQGRGPRDLCIPTILLPVLPSGYRNPKTLIRPWQVCWKDRRCAIKFINHWTIWYHVPPFPSLLPLIPSIFRDLTQIRHPRSTPPTTTSAPQSLSTDSTESSQGDLRLDGQRCWVHPILPIHTAHVKYRNIREQHALVHEPR